MGSFILGISYLVKEECRMTILHDDKNLYILVVYAQYIKKSKLKRTNRDVKRGRST